jgi:hypothetical protein
MKLKPTARAYRIADQRTPAVPVGLRRWLTHQQEATMAHRGALNLIVLVPLAVPWAARACGPGEAAAHSGRPAITADFKVLVWYNRSDPLGTFQYQVYDVRKGQYTAKVDDWIRDVQAKYPLYYVAVRAVDLNREKGKTEMLKVGAVVQRELTVAASLAGIVIGAGPSFPLRPGSGLDLGSQAVGPGTGARINRLPGSVGINRDYVNPAPTPFPIPVPYPRLPR